ncbi:hypothetical protein [Niallia nealsonii]|uniref:ABM domain-containing protein n=1 Tax=Niallia nealsonii TaxID=115979 RepID=A0A2N0Z078_9BACI|nr:hypothetical protein [Niallia nealsonii]PKG22914.1 hypothetical protein CWS01_14640 [Niallia nealsonii]
MTVFVYQTFIIKQDKFKEAIDNLNEIKMFCKENYGQQIEILTPITGEDHTYAMLSTYEGLAEMELQGKKMFEEEEYQKIIGKFFLENIVQGSMYTKIYRSMKEKSRKKDEEK